MSLSQFPSSREPVSVPLSASGTYTLNVDSGLYRVTTDTTQSLTSAQLFLSTADDARYGVTMRGGAGFVPVSSATASLGISAGTFPLILEFTKTAYAMMDAPVLSGATYTGGPSGEFSASFVAPPGATGMAFYTPNASAPIITATTSPQTITPSVAVALGQDLVVECAALDANGIPGLSASLDVGPVVYQHFLSSETFLVPSGFTQADVWLVGGGGGGVGMQSNVQTGGGGGGGRLITASNVAISGSVAIVIGAGGAAGLVTPGGAGGTTSFGTSASAAGGGGAGQSNVYQRGGTSAAGFLGGTSGSISGAGGGGGDTAVGVNSSGRIGGNGGAGSTASIGSFLLQVGGGGGGGGFTTRGNGVFGGGNGGQANQSGFPGEPNQGGGGGGSSLSGGGNVAGGAGGSGRAVILIKP